MGFNKIICLIFLLLLIFSCEEKEAAINQSPSNPTNISVSTTNFPEVEISWDNSVDIENDDITYKIYLGGCGAMETTNNVYWDCTYGDSLNGEKNLVGETTSNKFYIDNLKVLEGYTVLIKAVDAFGNESEAEDEGTRFKTIPKTAIGNI